MEKKVLIFACLTLVFALSMSAQTNNGTFDRFLGELKKHDVVYSAYKHDNMPILIGNTEMGGLADPLGRGLYETWASDLWKTPTEREDALSGFMLEMPELMNQAPVKYYQQLSLQNGELLTNVIYDNNKGYETGMFFSMDDKHKFVYKIKNTGNSPLFCIIELPYNGYSEDVTDPTIIKGSKIGEAFSRSAWSLQVNDLDYYRVSGRTYFAKKHTFSLKPGQSTEFVFSIMTHWDGVHFESACFSKTFKNYNGLLEDNNKAWINNWQNTGKVFLSDDKVSEVFYRSVFWMYCTGGEGRFLPAEVHFALISPGLEASYGYYSDKVNPTNGAWDMRPFTYGAPGWETLAFTMLGNSQKSKNILDKFYNPDILKKNVYNMFPIGKFKLYDYGEYIGEYTYLNKYNPNAMCFGHELSFECENFTSIPEHRYDWAVNLNAIAVAMFYRYSEYFDDPDFFDEKTYPVMKGVAEFWSELLNYDKVKDAYVLPVLLSLSEDIYAPNLIDGVLAAKWCLLMASREAQRIGKDKELSKKWKEISDKVYIPQNSQHYLEFENDSFTRKGGGYLGIRGFSHLGFPEIELAPLIDKKKANITFEEVWKRNFKGEGAVAFTVSWYALAAAYLDNPELAYEQLLYSNNTLDPSGTAMMEVATVHPYYTDNYAAYVVTVISMLLQTREKEIKPFAAIPKVWKDAEFYDLPAAKGIRVSGKMQDGKIQWVKYSKGGKVLLPKELKLILNSHHDN